MRYDAREGERREEGTSRRVSTYDTERKLGETKKGDWRNWRKLEKVDVREDLGAEEEAAWRRSQLLPEVMIVCS